MNNCELLIRHLPASVTSDDVRKLLAKFGAINVRYMGNKGRMALKRLHQLQVLDHRLIVVYAAGKSRKEVIDSSSYLQSDADKDEDNAVHDGNENAQLNKPSLPPVAPGLGLNYPSSPDLHYLYPEPNVMTMTNIVNAMLALPKFYNQVLHLMNRMHLPPPFSFPTPTPPMKSTIAQSTVSTKEEALLSSEESELESDDDGIAAKSAGKKRRLMKSTDATRLLKRPKINLQQITSTFDSNQPHDEHNIIDVFEGYDNIGKQATYEFSLQDAIHTAYNKHIESKFLKVQTNEKQEVESVATAGFGKFAPPPYTINEVSNEDNQVSDYITLQELRANRMPENELQKLSAYQKYERKDITSRLYIKNLSDKVKEKDLVRIYGRFVDFNDEDEANRFDVRLLTRGRMKGQAFISLPNEAAATKAIDTTHGYVMCGKPLIVAFAQSSKK